MLRLGQDDPGRRAGPRARALHVELDAIYHQPDWTPLDDDEFRPRVSEATARRAGWSTGTTRSCARRVWQKADTVVWFDLPYATVMSRTVRRTVRRTVTRQELWNGNREPLSNLWSLKPEKSIIAWAATRHKVYRQRYSAAEQDPRWADLQFVRLRSQAEADALVAGRDVRPDPRRSERWISSLRARWSSSREAPTAWDWPWPRRLAAEGASVAVCGRDEERLAAADATLREAGGDVLARRADVSRRRTWRHSSTAAVARWGRIDGVVHNAGRASGGTLESIDDATWEVRRRAQADGRRAADPPGPAPPAGQPGRRAVHPGHGGQGARGRGASPARSPVPPAWPS